MVRFNNSAIAAMAVAGCLFVPRIVIASSLPHVDLRDAEDHKVAEAEIHVHGQRLDIVVKPEAGQSGRYRFVLMRGEAKGGKCVPGQADEGQPLAQGPAFQMNTGNEINTEIEVPRAENMRDVKQMMAKREVMLALSSDQASVPSACGKVVRWYSPWKTVRQTP